MMLDRILVSDIQEEITQIQVDLKNLNEEIVDTQTCAMLKESSPAPTSASVSELEKVNINLSNVQRDSMKSSFRFKNNDDFDSDEKPSIDVLKRNAEKANDSSFLPNISNQTIKNELKGEQDLIPTTVNEFNVNMNANRHVSYKMVHNNNMGNVPSSPNIPDLDIKPSFQSVSNKENSLSQLDMNFSYDATMLGSHKQQQPHHHHQQQRTQTNTATFDVKKELDNLDIESEMPSYIIKKCDQSNREIVHSPLPSDFDYLCSPSDNSTNHTSSNSRRKDELISCDKEPYDEWLCIQKELNLISDKRSNDHLNIDGFMESTLRNFSNDDENPCSSSKLNVDNQFSDLFSQRTNDGHSLDDEKSDIDSHLPLSELFNDSIVNNAVDNVDSNDKSVENRLENMFSDNPDFDKTNDLVESRLEELFHGSSPPHSSVNASQAVNKM